MSSLSFRGLSPLALLIVLIAQVSMQPGDVFASLPEFGYPRVANYFLSETMTDSQAVALSRFPINFLAVDNPSWSPGAIDTLRAHNDSSLVFAFWTTESISADSLDAAYFPVKEALRESVLTNGWLARRDSGTTVSSYEGSLTINLSTKCPVGPNGLRYYEWLPGFINEILLDPVTRVHNVDWDGLQLDNIWRDVSALTFHVAGDTLDLNGNGYGDHPDSANAWWEAGSRAIVDSVRSIVGDQFPLVVNGTNYAFAANGRLYEHAGGESEGFTPDGSAPGATGWRAWIRDTDWAYLNTFDDYDTTLGPLNILKTFWDYGSHSVPDTVTTDGGYAFQSKLRLWLGTALLGDGFFAFGLSPSVYKSTWWRWEYDMDLGSPQGDLYTQLSCAGDTLYRRDFENGIVVVNPHDDPAYCGEDYPTILPWDSYIGPALGLQYVFGTIDTTVSLPSAGYGALYLPADLKIGSNGDVTLRECTHVYVATSDSLNIGGDNSLVEFIVEGELDIDGSDGKEVTLQSAAASPAEGDWWGIDVDSSAVLTIDFAEVKHSEWGIVCRSVETGHIANSAFSSNELTDMFLGSGQTMDLNVEDNAFTVGGGSGVEFQTIGTGVTLDGNTFTGNSSSFAGVKTGVSNSTSAPVIQNNTASGFSNGSGIYISGGADPTVMGNAVSSCKYGITVTDGTPQIGTSSTSSDNILTGNTNGIYVDKTTGAPLPIIRNNEIHSNTYGIQVRGNANPDIGTGTGASRGLNDLSGNNTYCIWSRNSSQTVSAQGNYFGACSGGVPPFCSSGSVDASNWECTEPAWARIGVRQVIEPAHGLRVLGVSPNPLQGAGQLLFSVEGGRGAVQVSVFDVAGRQVRSFGDLEVGPGIHQVAWDRSDDSGRPVGSGLYFVRVVLDGEEMATAKAFVVR